jgi:YjzC-like protein
MAAFHTGQKVSKSGTYNFAGHMSTDSTCQPTEEEKIMPLSKGETFPPCQRCDSSAYWTI